MRGGGTINVSSLIGPNESLKVLFFSPSNLSNHTNNRPNIASLISTSYHHKISNPTSFAT